MKKKVVSGRNTYSRYFHIILLLVLAAPIFLLYQYYTSRSYGTIFFFFLFLFLGVFFLSWLVLYLHRKGSRLWLPFLILCFIPGFFAAWNSGLRVAHSIYWVNHHPDLYAHGEIIEGILEGQVAIMPGLAVRDSQQTIKLTISMEDGIEKGGGLILRLGKVIPVGDRPVFYDCWYMDMWEEALQIKNRARGGYVSVIEPEGVTISLSKPAAPVYRKGIGNFLLNVFVADAGFYRREPDSPVWFSRNAARRHDVHLKVEEGRLEPGQGIRLLLGDMSGGSAGWRMPSAEADVDFVVYADTSGEGRYRVLSSHATLEVGGKEAASLEVILPSTPALGETITFVVRALDGEGYYSLSHNGEVEVLPQKGLIFERKMYRFSEQDRGALTLQAQAVVPGTYRIMVRDTATGQVYHSNPMVVNPEARYNLYWGDLHQHSALGKDANRSPGYIYRRNRERDRFDFASASEHDLMSEYWGLPLGDDEWSYLVQLTDRCNRPGEFVTFNGYEWTYLKEGHRNIYFAPDEEPVLMCYEKAPNPAELQRLLQGRRYLVIPHHTAWRLIHASVPYNWGAMDWEQLRLVEIYSKHGSSDHYHCSYPIHHGISPLYTYLYGESSIRAYEGLGSYVREALAKGYRLGFIAGSDNHWAEGASAYGSPGIVVKYPPGLQAVYAPELTREALFEAMWERRTYATTGARIIVDFTVNGYPMGSEIKHEEGAVLISFSVRGTGVLEAVELWKYSSSEGCQMVLFEARGSMELEKEFGDEEFREDSFYFIKVIQEDGHLAWASPVWVDKKN